MKKRLTIIVPIYNEANTLLNILNKVNEAPLHESFEKEIILIDDFSTDGSKHLIDNIIQNNVKKIYHKKNMGKGACIQDAIKLATGDFIIIQDADLEYDPTEINLLLEPILSYDADVVYGSRFFSSKNKRILYFWHTLGNKILTLFSNLLCNLNFTDMETCYKLVRKDILDKINLEEKRFGFEPEITAKLAKLNKIKTLKIYEVGISYNGRTYQEGKKINWKDGLAALWCIFKYNLIK
jgi:glycosyltransferase involved in cell wall biosynthesis